MTRSTRISVLTGLVVACVFAPFITVRIAAAVFRWRASGATQAVVLRQPQPSPAAQSPHPSPGIFGNIAPLAVVTVSSAEPAPAAGEGVADGLVNAREWVTQREASGAWIKLSWASPATVSEVALYDRADPGENVLSGTLTFDDGSSVAVPALPPAGGPWRIAFPPRPVRWMTFRIDRAEGTSAGLAEIMVMGTLNQ